MEKYENILTVFSIKKLYGSKTKISLLTYRFFPLKTIGTWKTYLGIEIRLRTEVYVSWQSSPFMTICSTSLNLSPAKFEWMAVSLIFESMTTNKLFLLIVI